MKNFDTFKKTLGFLAAAALAVMGTGCSSAVIEEAESSIRATILEAPEAAAVLTEGLNKKNDHSSVFSDRDMNPDFDNVDGDIFMNGDSGKCDNSDVEIDGATVKITKEGIYRISGTIDDGQIIVDAPDSKVQLILDNASIKCSNSSAIYGVNSKKIFVSLAENSNNTLESVYTEEKEENENEPDSCIFSKDSLTINGTGTLSISSGSCGIHSKDDVVITGGNINIKAEGDGIKGKDYVAVAGGTFDIDAGEDGIKSTNVNDESLGFVLIEDGSFTIDAAQDGIQAESELTINSGSFDITSGGGSENSTKTHNDMDFGGGRGGNRGGLGNMTPPDDFNPDDFGSFTPPDGFTPDSFGSFTPPDGFTPDSFGSFTPPDDFSPENPPEMPERTESTDDESAISTKGLKGGNSIKISGGTIKINSADDAIHSKDVNISGGSLEISSGDDGIHADSAAKIESGSINITKSYEGIEAAVIDISDGNINIKADDDGMNASDGSAQIGFGSYSADVQINISGGWIEVDAGGDGLDSNGDMTISDGVVLVHGSPSGKDAALDSNGEFLITGGTVLAAGMHDMIELPDSKSTQCVISATFDKTQPKGTIITLADEDGNETATFASEKSFDNIVISSPEIVKGKTYTISIDGAEYESITTDDIISTIGTQSGFGGGFGGFGGGRGDKKFQPPKNENGESERPDKRTPDSPAKNF